MNRGVGLELKLKLRFHEQIEVWPDDARTAFMGDEARQTTKWSAGNVAAPRAGSTWAEVSVQRS